MSIELVMPSDYLILCFPLLLLPSVFPSIRVFSNELMLGLRWPKHWSFSFSNSPSNEYSGLIFFRINWFDLPAAHRTCKSLLGHHYLKPSFFGVQLPLWSNSHTSIHDCWKNHSFDYIDLCQQSNQDAWVRGCKGFGNFWEGVSDEPIIKIFKIEFSNRLVIEVQIVSLQTLGSSRWYHVQP